MDAEQAEIGESLSGLNFCSSELEVRGPSSMEGLPLFKDGLNLASLYSVKRTFGSSSCASNFSICFCMFFDVHHH